MGKFIYGSPYFWLGEQRIVLEQYEFVERMEQMLSTPPLRGPCAVCPGRMSGCFDSDAWQCQICLDFIDARGKISCPCSSLGRSEAIKRAHLALERWDNAEHKWQTQK